MLFHVAYPGGERSIGTGFPGHVLVIREVPRGPECCYLDELEVDFGPFANGRAPGAELPVRRVVGGPRRPTLHVRVSGTEAERDAWADAREAEGWLTTSAPDDPSIMWVVATRDGLDLDELERHGGIIAR